MEGGPVDPEIVEEEGGIITASAGMLERSMLTEATCSCFVEDKAVQKGNSVRAKGRQVVKATEETQD